MRKAGAGKAKIGLAVTTLMKDAFNDFSATRPEGEKRVRRIAKGLARFGTVVCPGLIEDEGQAAAARELFLREGVDVVVYAAISYAKSALAMRLFRGLAAPMIVWNTQYLRKAPEGAGFEAMWTDSGLAGIPGATHVLAREGTPFSMVTSHVDDEEGLARIGELVQAAQIARGLASARVATVGHVYEGMTDFMIDHEGLAEQIGPLTAPVDPGRVTKALGKVSEKDARGLAAKDRRRYGKVEATASELEASARLALAMERVLVTEEGADAAAILDQAWLDDPNIGIVASYGYAHLNRQGVPCICEMDVATAVAQLILERVMGPSMLCEFYDMDFEREAVLLCHDSNGNPAAAGNAKEVLLKPTSLYVGAKGRGVTVEFACPPGKVTMLALVDVGGWKLVASEGESLETPARPMGAPYMLFRHSRMKLGEFCRAWCESGVAHHMGGAYGTGAERIATLGKMMGIETVVV
ncbi:MAG: hypothetical protein V2A58_16150 [Planctomycetota bacterium]